MNLNQNHDSVTVVDTLNRRSRLRKMFLPAVDEPPLLRIRCLKRIYFIPPSLYIKLT